MTLLQGLFTRAALPTDFNSQSHRAKMQRLIDAHNANAWYAAEMRVLRKYWVRGGWAVLPTDTLAA